jgi:NO-binding membrane sensor protein with MHYT domain
VKLRLLAAAALAGLCVVALHFISVSAILLARCQPLPGNPV